MPRSLQEQKIRLRRLQSDIERLAREPFTETTKLKALLLKNDLTELLRELRKDQDGVGEEQARSLASSTAATAYALQLSLNRKNKRA